MDSPSCHQPSSSSSNLSSNGEKPAKQEFIKYYKDMKKYFMSLINTYGEEPTKIASLKKSISKLTPKEKRRLKKKRREQNKKAQKYQEFDDDNPDDSHPPHEDDSHSIMHHYLSEFGQSDEWDWTAWRSYLQNMAETSPDWYNMFLEHSRAMGIDWQDMYKSWEQAEKVKLERQVQQAIVHEDSSDASSSSEDEEDNDGIPHWRNCKLCQLEFQSERAFVTHLRGVCHVQLVLERKKKRHPGRYAEETDRENAVIQNDLSKEDKHFEWLRNNMENEELELSGSFFCEICRVTCNSEKDIALHLNGTRHGQNVTNSHNANAKSVAPRLIPSSRGSPRKVVSRITSLLNMCLQSLVGLNYVIEFQPLDSLCPSRYHCQLCYSCLKKTLLPDRVIGHLAGYKHRRLFMKYNYPDLYEMIALDKSSISVRNKRLDVYAKRVEEELGRKRITIRLEIEDLEEKKRRYKQFDPDDDFFYNDHSESSSDDGMTVEELRAFNPLDYDDKPRSSTTAPDSSTTKPLFHVERGVPDPDKEAYYGYLQKQGFLSIPSITTSSVAQFHEEADWAIERKKKGLGNILSTYAKRSTSEVAAAAATAYILSMQQISEKIRDITGLGIDLSGRYATSNSSSSKRRRRRKLAAKGDVMGGLLLDFDEKLTSMEQIKDLFSKIKSMEGQPAPPSDHPSHREEIKPDPDQTAISPPVTSLPDTISNYMPIPVITSGKNCSAHPFPNSPPPIKEEQHPPPPNPPEIPAEEPRGTLSPTKEFAEFLSRKERLISERDSTVTSRRDARDTDRYRSKRHPDSPSNHHREASHSGKTRHSGGKRPRPVDLDEDETDDGENATPKKLSSTVCIPEKRGNRHLNSDSPPPVSNIISSMKELDRDVFFDAYSLFSEHPAVSDHHTVSANSPIRTPTDRRFATPTRNNSSSSSSRHSPQSTLSKINKLYGYSDARQSVTFTVTSSGHGTPTVTMSTPATSHSSSTVTSLPPELGNIDMNIDQLKAILGSVQNSSESKPVRMSHPKLPGLILEDNGRSPLPATPHRPRFGILPSISHPALRSPFFLQQAGLQGPSGMIEGRQMMGMPPPPGTFVMMPHLHTLMPSFVFHNMQQRPP